MSVDVQITSPGAAPEPPRRQRPLPRSRASWHTRANAVVLVWLALTVVAAVGGQGGLGVPRWLLIHLFLLGAVTNAIVTWSEHFATALLRLPPATSSWPAVRTAALNSGIVAVLWGAVAGHPVIASTGAGVIVWVVAWHVGTMIARARRALSGRFAHVIGWYVCAGGSLVVGGAIGGLLVSGRLPGVWSERLAAAHIHANLFGWVGLAVLGTLFTLWPTVLRTRMVEDTGQMARRSLRLAVPGLVVAVAGFAGGTRPLALAGLLLYAAAAVLALVPFLRTVRRRRPHSAAAWMLAAAVCWFVIAIAVDLAIVATREPDQVAQPVRSLVPLILAGFVGQVLLGSLTFLLPVVLGGGPAALKRNAALLERAWVLRLVTVNAAVPLIVLPVPPWPARIAWAGLLASLSGFIALAVTALVRSRWAHRQERKERPEPRGGKATPAAGPPSPARTPGAMSTSSTSSGSGTSRPSWASWASPQNVGILTGALLTSLALVVAVTAGGIGRPGGSGAPSGSAALGGPGVQTIDVALAGMRIRPGDIEVAPGTRLVLRVTNRDVQPHDLRFAGGEHTPMLRTGQTATLRLPPVTRALDGWCTVPGHRAAGMTMRIRVVAAAAGAGHAGMNHAGTGPSGTDQAAAGQGPAPAGAGHSGTSATGSLDLGAPMTTSWRPFDATLRPAPGGTDHQVEIRAAERELEVAPGVRQRMWTFNGQIPGPVLRGRVGDVFTVTFVNDGSMGHGIDFHAGSLAPDVPMRTIAPGERLTYRFRAERAGAWLYHCSTMPMMQHIANGMYGAVIIDPPGLPRADREYVLVQGELYLGEPGGTAQVAKMRTGRPDGWMFNGTASGYAHAPLAARTGERVRVWVVTAGPSTGTAFHVVGAQFDTVYKEGGYLLRAGDGGRGGAQVLDLAVAQGGFVETTFPEPGRYPFVDHDMLHGESGAGGFFQVTR